MAAENAAAPGESKYGDESAQRLEHPALRPAEGTALDKARLTDRQRIGVLFQAACALAHLERGGWTVALWSGARLDGDGLLSGLTPVPACSDVLPQRRLLELLRALFGTEGAPAGRGHARRVARDLVECWRQTVEAIAAEQAVGDLLARARFLWQDEFSTARSCLVAREAANGQGAIRVLGPGHFARAFHAQGQDLDRIVERLATAEAESLWRNGLGELGPRKLATAGRWRAAAGAWEAVEGKSAEQRLEFARCLYAVGRFEDALATLKGLRRSSARILRLWTLFRLGRLAAAVRELDAIDRKVLSARQRMQLLSVSLRVLENRGATRQADRRLAEGLRDPDPAARRRAQLLAALNAWDRGDLELMRTRLEELAEWLAPEDAPDGLAWRWSKAAGLEASARGDGVAAVEHFSQALRLERRRLTPFEAGALWNEMALGRAATGDLAGAERALLHTLRLHREVQGSRSTTSVLFNLAEIRMRRGRSVGTLDILQRATAEDRRARNWRSLAHDLELWTRYELTRGRPHAALIRAREALEELAGRGISWRSEELRALAARALGWLDRPDEARAELDQSGPQASNLFEAEEVPALWALAGDREAALAEIRPGPLRTLWTQVLTGAETEASGWRALEEIEPFRAGRFVFDVELVAPGTAPPAVLRRAVVALREAGAGPLAERLDLRDATSWRALGDYLRGRKQDADRLDRLFIEAGYPEARLVFRQVTGDRVLREGRGGTREIRRPQLRGELVLEAPYLDEVQKTLLVVLSRFFESLSEHGGVSYLDPPGTREAQLGRRSGIVGDSAAVVALLRRSDLLAASEVPILILGETGTGKELLAREVHARSRHSDGPFVAMNCAAVSEELLMSDLFGHVKGSFTGAARDRVGIFETARNGTVFLDEIGDLPLRAQGFLLRVVQEGEVRRVGESLPRKVSVRLVAATNRDLESMIQKGEFRADLYYRLRVGALELPPLREREDDIVLLADHFLRSDPASRVVELGSSALSRLRQYDWPGNVRELKNVLSVAVALAKGGAIRPEHLDLPYRVSRSEALPQIGYHELVLKYRRQLVAEALSSAGGNRAEAARRLGLTRQALSYLVRKLGLDT